MTKEAGFTPLREIVAEGGGFGNKRVTADFGSATERKAAPLRFNGMYENSGSFRDYVNLERYGWPDHDFRPDSRTKITLGYEIFMTGGSGPRHSVLPGTTRRDPVSTYFGNPEDSSVRAAVNRGIGRGGAPGRPLNIRNRSSFGDYDRGYQNYVPGSITADRTLVALSAYNNATRRFNVFNQTDLSWTGTPGGSGIRLLGAEVGRQLTDNFRNTGYLNDTATSISAPLDNPVIGDAVSFRQNATDADNHSTQYSATYLQDQVELSICRLSSASASTISISGITITGPATPCAVLTAWYPRG